MSRKNYKRRKPTPQQTRKLFLETLEGRLMLAVLPVANHEPSLVRCPRMSGRHQSS
ncbi:MAG: hypothetical protein IAF94_20535 [Pirellulaceae bacterium]|nr:hypothetical protein [Pirellulaceae bacterium]